MRPLRLITSSVLAVALAAILVAVGVPGAPAGAVRARVAISNASPFFSVSNAPISVDGSYTPLVGDFGGSAQDDIIWYPSGPGTDQLWISNGDGSFTKSTLDPQMPADAVPIVGHFANVTRDDIVWYVPGTGADWLAANQGNGTFLMLRLSVNGVYLPKLVPNSAGRDSILWASGTGPSSVWTFTGSGTGHITRSVTTPAKTQPLIGDFNGDGRGDIFWYGPGSIPDVLWFGNGAGTFSAVTQHVNGVYTPVVHDLTPGYDRRDDIFWFRPGGGASSLWQSQGNGTWFSTAVTLPKGTAVAADGVYGVIYLVRPGFPDQVWFDDVPGPVSQTANDPEIGAGYTPLLGNFVGSRDNIFWYKAGPSPEYLFYVNAIR